MELIRRPCVCDGRATERAAGGLAGPGRTSVRHKRCNDSSAGSSDPGGGRRDKKTDKRKKTNIKKRRGARQPGERMTPFSDSESAS